MRADWLWTPAEREKTKTTALNKGAVVVEIKIV